VIFRKIRLTLHVFYVAKELISEYSRNQR